MNRCIRCGFDLNGAEGVKAGVCELTLILWINRPLDAIIDPQLPAGWLNNAPAV